VQAKPERGSRKGVVLGFFYFYDSVKPCLRAVKKEKEMEK